MLEPQLKSGSDICDERVLNFLEACSGERKRRIFNRGRIMAVLASAVETQYDNSRDESVKTKFERNRSKTAVLWP